MVDEICIKLLKNGNDIEVIYRWCLNLYPTLCTIFYVLEQFSEFVGNIIE